MSHFSDEAWADFARGTSEAGERERVQSHLDRGCSECTKRSGLWSSVARLAGREASFEPPQQASRQAKAQFALHRPAGLLRRVSRALSLLFDSASAPLPVGVRASTQSSRQLVYGDGQRILRLRIDGQDDSERLSLVGQVLDARDPERALPTLPVLLRSGKKSTTRTLTNRFGEFAFELQPTARPRLVVGVSGEHAMSVSLPVRIQEVHKPQKAVAAGSRRG